jgi:hypothetical protein
MSPLKNALMSKTIVETPGSCGVSTRGTRDYQWAPMRSTLLAAIFFSALLISAPARADQDDMEHNADLQESPEELARAAVLRRWPDATELDAMDMAADAADADDDAAMNKEDDGDDAKMANEKEDPDPGLMADDGVDEATWTISVMFVSAGRKFEALTDDDGKIQYVYETIPIEDAPKNIVDAARAEVKDGDVIYVQKELDETQDETVTTYLVGVGDKDVILDTDGKVIDTKDAVQPGEEDDNDDGGRKMRI